jgi:hypothetical protein
MVSKHVSILRDAKLVEAHKEGRWGHYCLARSNASHAESERVPVKPAVAPSHRVITCHFHRTVRCPAYQKISSYIKESIQSAYASQIKDGSVKTVIIDFQDAKNQKST